MSNKTRLAAGAALAVIGGLGIVLSTLLGWTSLARPWSFLIGFGFGLGSRLGLGAVDLCTCHDTKRAIRGIIGLRIC